MKRTITLALCLAFIGCTDTCASQLYSYGEVAKIKCYSGTKLIYEGESTGKVESSSQSDGYLFRDKETDQLVEVSGNCLILY